jgi:hypothetical protein
LDTPILVAMLTINLPNLLFAAVCVGCLILLLRSSQVPADAARIGAAGFACLLVETIVAGGVQAAMILPRVMGTPPVQLGMALAAIGYLRLVLNAAGVILIARAIFIGRARDPQTMRSMA